MFLLVLSSLLALIYVGRIVEVVWFRDPGPNLDGVKEAPLSLLLPTALMAAATIYFGLETSQSAGIAAQAVETLLGLAK